MSTPRTDYEDSIHGALSEALSAISALNMAPESIPHPALNAVYLSDLDAWAKHAREHMHAVFDLMTRACREREYVSDIHRRQEIRERLARTAKPTWPGDDTP